MMLYQRTLIVSTTKKTHWATSTGDLKAEQRAGLFARSGKRRPGLESTNLCAVQLRCEHLQSALLRTSLSLKSPRSAQPEPR